MMRVLVVTGMSGAGKSQALKRLEDMGYFCVDNLRGYPVIFEFKSGHCVQYYAGQNLAVGHGQRKCHADFGRTADFSRLVQGGQRL